MNKENMFPAVVNALLEKYVGGEAFFDELDNSIRLDQIMLRGLFSTAMGEKHALEKNDRDKCYFIASGKMLESKEAGEAVGIDFLFLMLAEYNNILVNYYVEKEALEIFGRKYGLEDPRTIAKAQRLETRYPSFREE